MNIDTAGVLPLSAEDFIGQSVAVLGIKGSGKSNTAAVLMEELLQRNAPICVVDIAGEYHSLKGKYPRVVTIGRSHTHRPDVAVTFSNVQSLAQTAYTNGGSVVIDVSALLTEEREELLRLYFSKIWELSVTHRIPLVCFLEEAHNWVPQGKQTAVKKIFTDIASEGRKRGLSLVVIGQRSARIDKDILTQADIAFLHRVRHPADLRVYTDMIPRPGAWTRERVNNLKVGQALTLIGEQVLKCVIRPRATEHVGATPTLANVPATQMSLLELMKR